MGDEWLEAFCEGLGEGIARIDGQGRILHVNAAFRRMLPSVGARADAVTAWPDFVATLPALDPGGPAARESLRRLDLDSPGWRLRNAAGALLALRVCRGPGAERLVTVREGEAGLGSLSAEDALVATLRQAPVGLVLLDPDDRIILWNEAVARHPPADSFVYGMTLEALLWSCLRDGNDWRTRSTTSEQWVRNRLDRHRNYTGPFEERIGDGSWFLTSEHRSADGHTLIIHMEISAQKRAEAELIVARDQADRANRAKSEFLANMSHELRTPLNAIMGFSEVIRDQSLGPIGHPRYAEYAGDIYESGRHLLDLVNTILDLAKIESGQFDLTLERVDIGEEIAASLRLFEMRTKRAALALTAEIEAELPIIRADRRAVRQMLLNLVSNAVAYTPSGGHIVVSARRQGAGVVVTVTDDGPGIAAEDLPRALEPFGQVAGPRKADQAPGTGLGLPLVRALIGRHGGSFDIRTAPGEGTSVALTFPG